MSRRYLVSFAIFLFILSCIPETGGIRSNNLSESREGPDITPPNPDDGGDTPEEPLMPAMNLRHIIDPYDGNYKAKITIPKHFSGTMIIAGNGLARLKELGGVWVRFRFGRNLTSFELPALVAPIAIQGLTNTATIDVLQVDLSQSPFNSLRLTYHLYDYNQYSDGQGPAIDPFDDQLYCRALTNQHDPTFNQNSSSASCNQRGQRCLYSYAQVFDQGPYVNGVPGPPSEQQFALNDTGLYNAETNAELAKKCLADNANDSNTLGNVFAIPNNNSPGPIIFNIDDSNYHYRGPYEARSLSSWQIIGDALAGSNSAGEYWGLFERLAHPGEPGTGFYSLKFPRAGRLPVRPGVQYIGQDTTPLVTSHPTRGFDLPTQDVNESLLMDGCNLRVKYFNSISREGIESCDVTALIELVKRDPKTGKFQVIDRASETRLKVQLVRKTTKTPLQEDELMSSNFGTCSSNSSCGSNECCYNNRCWSRDIVTQCLDDSQPSQSSNGQSCTNDLECQSLCCSPGTGTCRGHDGKQNLCSKPLGSSCLSDEFCVKVSQTHYRQVKIPGQTTCKWQSSNVQVFGQCVRSGTRGTCTAPPLPPIPDLNTPIADCSDAEDP